MQAHLDGLFAAAECRTGLTRRQPFDVAHDEHEPIDVVELSDSRVEDPLPLLR
jgi:hypothetical protein